jgi:hypothetical protein
VEQSGVKQSGVKQSGVKQNGITSKMGSDQISGHAHSGDSKAITKICSDPILRPPPGDYKKKLASKRPVCHP